MLTLWLWLRRTDLKEDVEKPALEPLGLHMQNSWQTASENVGEPTAGNKGAIKNWRLETICVMRPILCLGPKSKGGWVDWY